MPLFSTSEPISGWGRFPTTMAHLAFPKNDAEIAPLFDAASSMIPRGFGRSYGDASLQQHVIASRDISSLCELDKHMCQLTCSGNLSIDQVLTEIIPEGFFLPVIPGTGYVSIGGAIAADIHGKNHHHHGSFCHHVQQLTLMTPDLGQLTCSPDTHAEIFYATCGGMGLTGVIYRAVIKVIPITTAYIKQTHTITQSLDETLDALKRSHQSTYSVAWIDSTAKGTAMGRGVVICGNHAQNLPKKWSKQPLKIPTKFSLSIPWLLPNGCLNTSVIRMFNRAYYWRHRIKKEMAIVSYASFFFPLDQIMHWHRLYGKQGLVQYQFYLPMSTSQVAIKRICKSISHCSSASFLSVLKYFGPGNDGLLSFPDEGLTLAMDFPNTSATHALLNDLDHVVTEAGGRIYLAKDSRMSQSMFYRTQPNIDAFKEIKQRVDSKNVLKSLLSQRLGL